MAHSNDDGCKKSCFRKSTKWKQKLHLRSFCWPLLTLFHLNNFRWAFCCGCACGSVSKVLVEVGASDDVIEVSVESGRVRLDGEVNWVVEELEEISVVKYSLAVVVFGMDFGVVVVEVVVVVESSWSDDGCKRGKKWPLGGDEASDKGAGVEEVSITDGVVVVVFPVTTESRLIRDKQIRFLKVEAIVSAWDRDTSTDWLICAAVSASTDLWSTCLTSLFDPFSLFQVFEGKKRGEKETANILRNHIWKRQQYFQWAYLLHLLLMVSVERWYSSWCSA